MGQCKEEQFVEDEDEKDVLLQHVELLTFIFVTRP